MNEMKKNKENQRRAEKNTHKEWIRLYFCIGFDDHSPIFFLPIAGTRRNGMLKEHGR